MKPDKNSKRQRLLALEVHQEITFTREEIKPGSLGSMLWAIKRDEGKSYSYKVDGKNVTVTRIS